ncbi:MAG: Sua5/YciO/YrdC/YwlC family protein [Myxococcota bacterium]
MDVYLDADACHAWSLWCARLARGDVAILPTDTIYGLSGNALLPRTVRRIGALKRRRRPATVIPHDVTWARALIHPRWRSRFDEAWSQHPGTTLLFPYAPDPRVPQPADELVESGLIGLRQPRHWVSALARDAGVPLVSTSVNVSGRPPMTGWDDLPRAFRERVDFCVTVGPLPGRPSALLFLDRRQPRRVDR